MAQPTNTFDSYDMKGIREDLSDVIYNVAPEDTPFYSRCKKVDVKNTMHEWQTDTLRAAAENAHVEGDDTAATARTATVRLNNRTQIFKDAVVLPDTEEGLNLAGRTREMAYQTMKIAAEQKLDIELALFANVAKVTGDSTTARKLAGLPTWVFTNSSNGASANPGDGDGATARVDGTLRALTQANFDTVMQAIWTSGGKPNTVYLSPFQMNEVLNDATNKFVGMGNQRTTIDAAKQKIVNALDVYVTPWGTVTFQPSRLCRSRDVWILQDDMWKVGVLRPTKNVPLAKTGDNTKRQVVTELTLIACNEKSSGAVFDCLES
jgi:Family of unknown function (DUF5309)